MAVNRPESEGEARDHLTYVVAMCLAHILQKYVIIITAISAIDFETQPRNVLLGIIERKSPIS